MMKMKDDPDFAPGERQHMLERSARAFEKLVTLGNVTSMDSDNQQAHERFIDEVILTISELIRNSPAVFIALRGSGRSPSEIRQVTAIVVASIIGRPGSTEDVRKHLAQLVRRSVCCTRHPPARSSTDPIDALDEKSRRICVPNVCQLVKMNREKAGNLPASTHPNKYKQRELVTNSENAVL